MNFNPFSSRLKPLSELMSGLPSPQPVPQPAPAPLVLRPTQPALAQDQLQSAPLSGPSAQGQISFVQSPLIGPNDRVLHIGDSHTVGIYGREMDKHLRSTGAKVETYGSAGSSPRWWITGQSTHSGFYGKDESGKTDAPANWRDPHPTPKLADLLKRFRPNVVMISLGANMLGSNPAAIEKQVKELADIAKASGAKIIWVGPPDGRESVKPTSQQAALYEQLQKTASQYGDFIDSRPLTEYPASGGDGVHYWGKEGTKRATAWAQEVFNQLQALPE